MHPGWKWKGAKIIHATSHGGSTRDRWRALGNGAENRVRARVRDEAKQARPHLRDRVRRLEPRPPHQLRICDRRARWLGRLSRVAAGKVVACGCGRATGAGEGCDALGAAVASLGTRPTWIYDLASRGAVAGRGRANKRVGAHLGKPCTGMVRWRCRRGTPSSRSGAPGCFSPLTPSHCAWARASCARPSGSTCGRGEDADGERRVRTDQPWHAE